MVWHCEFDIPLTAAGMDGTVVLPEVFRDLGVVERNLSPFPDECLLLHSHCQCLSSASISSGPDYPKRVLTGDDADRSDQHPGG